MQRDKGKKSSKLEAAITVGVGEIINASGHKQELERQFSLLPICAVGITTGNVWAALGGSIVRCYMFMLVHVWDDQKIRAFLDFTCTNENRPSLSIMADLPVLSTDLLSFHASTS